MRELAINVDREHTYYQVAELLKSNVFVTIAAIVDGIPKVMVSVDLKRDLEVLAKQIDLQGRGRVELYVEREQTAGPGTGLELVVEYPLGARPCERVFVVLDGFAWKGAGVRASWPKRDQPLR
jgi:hypothetical protein